jgi:hypothetical protein
MEMAVRILQGLASAAVLMFAAVPVAQAAPAPTVQSSQAAIRTDVRKLIEQIAALPPDNRSAERQQALFDQLIAKGPDAVPTIIALMDDRRRLAVPAISLVNKSPDAFEGMRHYGPALMVDALSAVLNQITGEHFGFIYNGASDAERRATVTAWRQYLRSQPSPRV